MLDDFVCEPYGSFEAHDQESREFGRQGRPQRKD